jgi:hypothetical protein
MRADAAAIVAWSLAVPGRCGQGRGAGWNKRQRTGVK